MKRREFVRLLGAGGMMTMAASEILDALADAGKSRPNILWISTEDIGPLLGSYGDQYAKTPNLDKLASEGVRYTNVFSVGAICSPSRSSIITGMYPSTLGSHHHRSMVQPPEFLRFFPYYLRQAGYFCTNNFKGDYNMPLANAVWDENGRTAHWRNRRNGQPFFSVFNLEETHSSIFHFDRERAIRERLTLLKEEDFHDPDQAPMPPHYPDTPIVRERITNVYDAVTQIDYHVKDILDELESESLLEDTIVFFWADQGTLPHGKTRLWDTGTHVPLIVRFPEKFKHLQPGESGSSIDDVISLMDLGPTVLNLAEVPIPEYMDAQNFLGKNHPRSYAFSIRDRFDYRPELIRSVRDKKYRYIRNFFSHYPYTSYWPDDGFYVPNPRQKPDILLWQKRKPCEELYDTTTDPYNIDNLTGLPEYADLVKEMRNELYDWMIESRDLGLIDEPEMIERAGSQSPYYVGEQCNNWEGILETADLSRLGESSVPELMKRLMDTDAVIRYWAIVGLTILSETSEQSIQAIKNALSDNSLSVQLAAVDALCRLNMHEETLSVLKTALESNEKWTRCRAAFLISFHNHEDYNKMQSLLTPLKNAFETETDNVIRQTISRAISNLEK